MNGVRYYDPARADHFPEDSAMHFSGHRAGEYEMQEWTTPAKTLLGLLKRSAIVAASAIAFCAASYGLMVSF